MKIFQVKKEITRPANTTQYSSGDFINGSALTTLITVPSTGNPVDAGQGIQINECTIMSDYAGASPKMDPSLHFFSANTFTGITLTDHTANAITYALGQPQYQGTLRPTWQSYTVTSQYYTLYANQLGFTVKLDSSKQLYIALIENSTYTPASGEKITIFLSGIIL